ncbi:MAG: hypothetical protein AAFY06_07180 [Pseudomonadota bacterium]
MVIHKGQSFGLAALYASMPLITARPVAAQASVCSHSRPNWDITLGDTTWVGEALHILTSSGVIALFLAMVLAVRFKNVWFTLVLSAVTLVACYFYHNAWTVSDPKSVMFRSITEGCVGPPYGAILVLLAAVLVLLGWQFLGTRRHADEHT